VEVVEALVAGMTVIEMVAQELLDKAMMAVTMEVISHTQVAVEVELVQLAEMLAAVVVLLLAMAA
jgi:hypothetical protein